MSIRDMTVDTFWKGEVRVQAVAEDGEGSYRTRIFIKNGEIYDYHCSCPYGSSYKGICEHGLELFKKYRLREQEMNALPVSTSPAVRSMIREYTNREVARIMGEETAPVVEFVPGMPDQGKEAVSDKGFGSFCRRGQNGKKSRIRKGLCI